jgi:putative oxidoreductase
LLLLRLAAGGIMFWQHGLPKFLDFGAKAEAFRDPIGIGSWGSLALITFAEVFCALLVALGLWTRAALLPLIIGMVVVVFIVHGDDPFSKQEMGTLYLLAYLTLFLTGAGRYSVDRVSFR